MHPYGTVKNPRAVRNVAAGRDDRESESDEPDDTMAGVELI